jgi:hypothetical protein
MSACSLCVRVAAPAFVRLTRADLRDALRDWNLEPHLGFAA